MIDRSVDLPEPLGPSSATRRRGSMLNETPAIASMPPNERLIFSAAIAGLSGSKCWLGFDRVISTRLMLKLYHVNTIWPYKIRLYHLLFHLFAKLFGK